MPLYYLTEVLFFFLMLTVLSLPAGKWLAWCFMAKKSRHSCFSEAGMTWKTYCLNVLTFSVVCLAGLILILRFQTYLPFNPQKLSNLSWALAFNTAASFVSNTNWQAYSGELTLSQLSQSAGLTVQNFLSAAVGLCVMAVLIRGLKNQESALIGNFWIDLRNVTLFFLLPLSVLLSLFLIQQGVPQTFKQSADYADYESNNPASIPLGPVASQIAIKQLGTNGGGYYNVNSAHPLENPTPLSNFFEMLAILLVPAACCHAFGIMIADKRQGWSLFLLMLMVSLAATLLTAHYEFSPEQKYFPANVGLHMSQTLPGNMEGKDTRFGAGDSSLWAVITTAASNGSVNSMHDSFTAPGGLMPMFLMQLGEVVFGGVGSGLYGMLAFVIVTVFIAGLMVGRSPEYLGKKIEVPEIKMVSLIVLIPGILVLVGTALTIAFNHGPESISNPGPHGFSQILYAYSSMGNNNGSAFGGFNSTIPFHLYLGGIIMLLSRFLLIVPVLSLAGSLGLKKVTPASSGTLPTHTFLFCALLLSIILIVGGLTFIPAIVLGPVAESLL